jgi:hypothetical protein
MKSLVAVMCVLTMAAGVALARPAEEIQKELREAQKEYNMLRWSKFGQVAGKFLAENEEYQALVEKEKAAAKAREDGLRALAEKTEEGKALYAKVDRLQAEMEKVEGGADRQAKTKEFQEARRELAKFLRDSKIMTWENEEFVAVERPRVETAVARFEKGMELLRELDEPEAQDFVAQIKAAEEKVQALQAELKEAKEAQKE